MLLLTMLAGILGQVPWVNKTVLLDCPIFKIDIVSQLTEVLIGGGRR
jgi:hypothetical protein